MTAKAVATGLWLAISNRLNDSEFVQATGFGIEKIEKRACLKPGGLLRELEYYRTHGDEWAGIGFQDSLWMFLVKDFIHPYDQHATGHPRDYWLEKLDQF